MSEHPLPRRSVSRASARELERLADAAQEAFWFYVRVAHDEEPPIEVWEAVEEAMNRLTGAVESRKRL